MKAVAHVESFLMIAVLNPVLLLVDHSDEYCSHIDLKRLRGRCILVHDHKNADLPP